MKWTVAFLAALIGVVAWFTHEPVRDELSAPMEVIAGGVVGVAEASTATQTVDPGLAEARGVVKIEE